jgi:transposase
MRDLALNRRQLRRLRQQLKHTHDASLYRRTFALVELAQGSPVTSVARSLGVSRQTLYNWIDIYSECFDPLALRDAARSGRPTAWTPDLQELLETLLRQSPTDWDYQSTQWTVPLLQQQLATWDGRWLSEDTIRRRLHEAGYVWKRTRYVLPPDPEKEKKTPHTPAASEPAPAQCRPFRGRNRSAAVSAAAGDVVAARSTGARAD